MKFRCRNTRWIRSTKHNAAAPHGQNPFDYLTEVQRHAKAVADCPQDWLPWTYKATLSSFTEPHAAAPDRPSPVAA
jgi:hypothetical protein